MDLQKGIVENITKNKILEIHPLSNEMLEILNSGGLVNFYKKYGSLEFRKID